MWKKSELAARLGIKYPLIQGPFGGGLSTSTLVAEVSNRGGLGSYGAHLLSSSEIEQLAIEIRGKTSRAFAINLWVSEKDALADRVTREEFEHRRDHYGEVYQSLNVNPPSWTERIETRFEKQVEAILRIRPSVFSFVFGVPDRDILAECRKAGIVTIGAATTVEEALLIEEAGCDIVLATGFEAGGHRPSFLKAAENSLMGTLALVPLIKDRVKIPVIAGGGIGDSRGIKAAFSLGADAVQLGTAFLACRESGASPAHRKELLSRPAENTVLSRGFTGRLARYLPNEMTQIFEQNPQLVLPFPRQSQLTAMIRKQSIELQNRDYLALYASQVTPLLKYDHVEALMHALVTEMDRMTYT